MKFSLGTNIKQKLIINAALVAAGMVFMLLLLIYSNSKSTSYTEALQLLESFNTNTSKLKVQSQGFLASKDLAAVEEFNQLIANETQDIAEFKKIVAKQSFPSKGIESYQATIARYQKAFSELVELQKKIGLNPKDGLYGELRGAVHNIETLLKEQNNYLLLTDMLQLRRAEKDFMLRYDLKYLDKFNDGVDKLSSNIRMSDIDPNTQSQLQNFLSDYQQRFRTLVEAESEKGLDSESGVRAELEKSIVALNIAMETMDNQINAAIASAQTTTQFAGFILFAVLTIIVLASTYVTSTKVLSPIKEISSSISLVRDQNDLTTDLTFSGSDEVSAMGRQFNELIKEFRELINKVVSAVQALDAATVSLVNNSRDNTM